MTPNQKTLYDLITDTVSPYKISSQTINDSDFCNWTNLMSRECIRLRQKMVGCMLSTASKDFKQDWLASLQRQITFHSDTLNHYLFRQRHLWQQNSFAMQIRGFYIRSLCAFEELLEFAAHQFPEYYDFALKITNFQFKDVIPELRSSLFDLGKLFSSQNISEALYSIVIGGLYAILDGHPTRNDAIYMRHFFSVFQSQTELTDQSLVQLLLRLDFNQPEFYLYQIAIIDERLFNVHGLYEQRELLSQEKYALLKLKKHSSYHLHPRQSPLLDDLQCYFQEREEAIDALLEIRRKAVQDRVAPNQAFRILVDMSVPQLALFFRIQMEVGLIVKEQISEVFNFVAQHFYTEKAHFISSTNLLKLSTTIEFQTVLKVYDMLSMMIKWLDDQFGVSNYSR